MKTFLKFILIFIFVMPLSHNALVQQEQKKDDPSRWTPEDIINTESMSSVSISPKGNMVVWTKRKGVKKKDRFVSDIYLTRLDSKKNDIFRTIQLTNGDHNDYSPIFSKDGEHIYFLSSRDKGKKLWVLNIFGGEAKEIKEFKNGISSLQWKDNNTLLFRSNDGKTLLESQLEEKKDNVIVVEDSLHWKPNHVYAYDLSKKSVRRLTNNKKPIRNYTVSPNGKWLIYSMNRSITYAADQQKDPFYFLKNLETGAVKQVINDRGFPIGSIRFSKDNKGFYFLSDVGSDPKWNGAGITELFYFNIAAGSYKKVTLKWELGVRRGYHVVGNDVMVSLANKTGLRLAYYKKKGTGWVRSRVDLGIKNDHTMIQAVADNGTKIIYSYSTASKIPSYYVADLRANKLSNEQELVQLNKKLHKKSITKSEVMVWEGHNGDEVTGILYYPENYKEGKKYPLMLSIHGGPTGADMDFWSERWSTYPNLLAQRGMFILKPNYHGSGNHGLAFVESIKEDYYEPGLVDIINGIEVLAKQGKVDKEMLGTMGWSAGAILTTMLTLKYPDMFKVAAPGAGDVNWTSDYGTCRFGVNFDQYYFGGAPWDDVNGKSYNEEYISLSPLFEIEKIKTPTIIFHGSEDRAVPRDQGWEYYRGLQQVGKAPVRFLWFPGQPHGLQKITHQLRKMKEEIAWIDTYLFNKPPTKNEAFKENSPLGHELKLQEAKTIDGLYGVLHNELLVPETVLIKKDSIAIGRFEVTNAQFKVFNADFDFNSGLDNYPAVVDRTNAKGYVKWLSQKTGATYRLPTAKEGKMFHQKAHKIAAKENTLNYWAGYAITKDDISDLRQKLKEVNTTLLKKVGKKKGVKIGDATVYDLGGNVAEYFDGGVYGYSAYDFYDAHDDTMVKSTHVGIRVIKQN